MNYIEVWKDEINLIEKLLIPEKKIEKYQNELERFNVEYDKLRENFQQKSKMKINCIDFDDLTKKCSSLCETSLSLIPHNYFMDTIENLKKLHKEFRCHFVLEEKIEKENKKRYNNHKNIFYIQNLLIEKYTKE